MKLDVLKESENKLLHRKELDIVLKDLSATPSKKDVIAAVSANLGAPENAIVLGSIHQKFGKREARVYVRVYESEEKRKSVELKPKENKETKEEPKKEGEKK